MPSAISSNINQPKHLWFLMLSYVVVILLANWFDPRLVSIFHVTTDAGTLIFPLTFLLSDLITEVYGYRQARRAIWCGFLFNALFMAYGQLIIHLPSPEYHTHNAAFDALLGMDGRIIIASTISYFCSEPLNALLMAKLKIKTAGRYMSLRFLLSTVIAAGADSFIFGALAFYATMSHANLLALILTMWLIKVIIELLGLPLAVRLAKKLKAKEKLDIFDTQTQFNLLSLEADYQPADNQYDS